MVDNGLSGDNGHNADASPPSVYSDDGVTIIGMIGVVREADANRGATLSLFGGGINPGAEVPSGVDPDYILDFARTHEAAGFDLVLTGYSSSTPDGFEIAGYAAAHTQRLSYLIAHRPRIRCANPRRPQGRHPRPTHQRTHRPAHHHRRQRPGAAAGRRLARP